MYTLCVQCVYVKANNKKANNRHATDELGVVSWAIYIKYKEHTYQCNNDKNNINKIL